MEEEKTLSQKFDGYNSVFKDAPKTAMPFYMAGLGGITLSEFYENDGLARRIVDVVPEEMIAAGFKIDGVKDDSEFRSDWDGLRLEKKITDALCWQRLHGGSAIVMMVRDNRRLISPVKEGAKIEDIRVYDRYQVQVDTRETNAKSPRYGEPVTYKINPGDNIGEYKVHYTRVHILDGKRMTNGKRKESGGWGASILNARLIESIMDYNYCEELATQLLRRKQQAVWKARGLADMCDDKVGEYSARLRLAQVSDSSGVGQPIGIDSEDEEYSVLNSDISGVAEFLQQKMDRIVSLSGIHEVILKNKNVGGVSQSQNTALETFYKLIERERKENYRPILEFLLPFIITEQEWSVSFDPLSIPSDKDAAEILNKNADTIIKLVSEQAMGVEEARDTIRSLMPEIKLTESKLPKGYEEQQEETEPEPGDEEVVNNES